MNGVDTAHARNVAVLGGRCPDDDASLYPRIIDGEAWLVCPLPHHGEAEIGDFHLAFQPMREPTEREHEFGVRWRWRERIV